MELLSLQDSENEVTKLILSIFRVNGALLVAGDRLTASIGLTSARWQVLGAVAKAADPLTVAAIGKSMGLTRQNVRIIVRELEAAGMVRLADNPAHQRASLVRLTPKGKRANASARDLQGPFTDALSKDLDPSRIANCVDLLHTLYARLKSHNEES
ncbi:MarR family winged helix-turn-helix transcriptional regulator [Granulicella cerasi]|uniref:MarR family winged helix-turn-helix transcriptional regulator n=1 Tax=Granulicella cerasi TaxID=741063 RepID=A0ABW1ZEH1_9BACT|nr:MarR family transcriptional regulator [Granulicella cerasi]